MTRTFRWLKGHGTENDFVVLPDPDGSVHGHLDPALVAALCHRRRGIGADGVLRVVRTEHVDPAQAAEATWFMDHRNADGSVTEMCGNGVRVLARYLAEAGLVDSSRPLPLATRDGVKCVTFLDNGDIEVAMGTPEVHGRTTITVGDHIWEAQRVSLGNPHAVVGVDDLAQAGPLLESPGYRADDFPAGVNVEFVREVVPGHLAMRVYERGSGETRSCGTGACAVVAAHVVAGGIPLPVHLRIDVPGGRLQTTWHDGAGITLAGPAVLGARGELDPAWLAG